jgi:hypothetical protein
MQGVRCLLHQVLLHVLHLVLHEYYIKYYIKYYISNTSSSRNFRISSPFLHMHANDYAASVAGEGHNSTLHTRPTWKRREGEGEDVRKMLYDSVAEEYGKFW